MIRNMLAVIKNEILPKDTLIGAGISVELTKDECIQYFNKKINSSKKFIEDLITRYSLYNKTIVSIGSGFGAEEILMEQLGNAKVTALEPDKNAIAIHKHFNNALNTNNILIHSTMDEFQDGFFDVVYTSSPSNWMYNKVSLAISNLSLLLTLNSSAKFKFKMVESILDKLVVPDG